MTLIEKKNESSIDYENMNNGVQFYCPKYEDGDMDLVKDFEYWLGGVAQCCVAFGGLIGNLISAVILSR